MLRTPRFASLLLALVAATLLPGDASAGGRRARSATTRTARPRAVEELWTGVAHNLTVDQRSGVQLALRRGAGGASAVGAFDNVQLFGRFDARGASDPSCAGAEACLSLRGVILLGDGDGSGFPDHTLTTFTLTLRIRGSEAVGEYRIGALPGVEGEQRGTVSLRRAR